MKSQENNSSPHGHLAFDLREIYRQVRTGQVSPDEAARLLARLEQTRDVKVRINAQTGRRSPLYYQALWEEAAIDPVPQGEPPDLSGLLLIFDQTDRICRLFRDCLQPGEGKRVPRLVLVMPADRFTKVSPDHFQINPKEIEHFSRLWGELTPGAAEAVNVLHLWNYPGRRAESGPSFNLAATTLTQDLETGLYALFRLIKTAVERRPRARTQILFLHGAPDGLPWPHDSAVAGLALTAQKEHPGLICKSIELNPAAFSDQQIAEAALAELGVAARHPFTEIRYTAQSRKVRLLSEYDPDERAGERGTEGHVAGTTCATVRRKGVYLITGGMGGLGKVFARHLAENYQARLILTGRSPFHHGIEQFLGSLEAAGAQACYCPGEISQRDDVERILQEGKRRFGELNGIIHSAGLIEDALILKKTEDSFARVLGPKVLGTLFLDEATKDEPLDFVALFSSLAGVIGNPGQSDYASANRFLDAFAESREALRLRGERHGRTVSINWPLWEEGGMRVAPELRKMMVTLLGLRPLTRAMGVRAFRDALSAERVQIGVVDCDAGQLRQLLHRERSGLPPRSPVLSVPAIEPGANGSPAGEESRAAWEQALAAILCAVLKVKPADLDFATDLTEYGVDSILLAEILAQLEKQSGVSIDASVILENPTIASLARYLSSEQSSSSPRPSPPLCGREGEVSLGFSALGHNSMAVASIPQSAPPFPEEPHHPETATAPVRRRPSAPAPAVAEPIAVISLACRFPGSNTVEEFWANLSSGKNLIREVPGDRWDPAHYYDPDKKAPGKTYSKWGGFMEGIDLFDAGFFGVSDNDARTMDPQHRVLLELAQELFERAGYARSELRGSSTGIFLGTAESGYGNGLKKNLPNSLAGHVIVNTIQNMMAGRIANFYDLRGPASTLDTACSSSLVAIHQACQSLYSGETEMAIAGGITFCLSPHTFIGFCKAGALADTPVPHVFDLRSNGFLIGEGAGLVLLKPLSRAREEGDRIAGLILGSAVNNDGQTMGLTTPNLEGQKAVMEAAYQRSGINPATISYLEAHGTGTLLGDPIEVKAATQVIGARTRERQFCGLGSVKSNMGHTFHAAGAAAFIKVMLALEHKQIPPTLHCEKPHPRFHFEDSPFYPATRLVPFPDRGGARRAGISAFGFGGTNCHLVVEEFDPVDRRYQPVRKALPLTQFNRQRYWIQNTDILTCPLRGTPEKSATPPQEPERPLGNEPHPARAASERSSGRADLESEIQAYLIGTLADELKVPAGAIDPEATFAELGFQSTSLVQIAQRLEDELALELYPTLLLEFPNLALLSAHFAEAHSAAFVKTLRRDAKAAAGISPGPGFLDAGGESNPHSILPPSAPAPAVEEAPPQPLAADIEKFLRKTLSERLEVSEEQIPSEANFLELGIDSVQLIQMAEQFETELGIELYPTLFFEYQNIEQLAAYFAREHSGAFRQVLGLKAGKAFVSDSTPIPAPLPRSFPDADSDGGPAPVPGSAALPPAAPHPQTTFRAVPPSGARPVDTRDIAIIGMAGRFPGADTTDEFWDLLKSGTDLIKEIPADHWDYQPWFDPRPQAVGKLYCKWGAFLDGVDKFDAPFFRVSPREAEFMDPQLRILLEVLYSTAEDAGYATRLRGTRTGVYIGNCFHDYGNAILDMTTASEPFHGTGNAGTMLANRPSYLWDLRGPSLALDTACSSSLVALHLACQALRAGDCDLAFAAGVNLILSPYHYLYFCSIGALSPTGKCHSFDQQADGYVPGEAVASVLLKPLSKALEDGDPIHAIIKGSAVNHGGYTNTVTAPSPRLEAEVISKAWIDAGIDPATISYLEAHGTGTRLGDPVEIQGIKMAFKAVTGKTAFCAVGSAKANVGHTEGSAGIVGVVKTVLSLKHRYLPPLAGFKQLNPLIDLERSPLFIQAEGRTWNDESGPLRAGVSSFGFGGTYAHVLLEAAPIRQTIAPRPQPSPASPELILLSAKHEESLKAYAGTLCRWLQKADQASLSLGDLAYSLQVSREPFEERLALMALDREDLVAKLTHFLAGKKSAGGLRRGTVHKEAALEIGAALEDQKYLEDLFRAGRLDKLGNLWTAGAAVDWKRFYQNSGRRLLSLPTYCFQRNAYWHQAPKMAAQSAQTILPIAGARTFAPSSPPATPLPTNGEIEKPRPVFTFLQETIAKLVGVEKNELDGEADLAALGFDSIKGMHLIKAIQEQYGLQLYANEALMHPSLQGLSGYVEKELEKQLGAANGPLPPNELPLPSRAEISAPSGPALPRSGGPSIAFILSTPRAGSTLLRVMLAGHSGLFCPPELHLLPFADLPERAGQLSRAKFLNEGLVRALMELKKFSAEEAAAWIDTLEKKGTTIQETYRRLRELAGERLLIDKSPSYAEDLAVLRRAEKDFPGARYIFLVRHPLAVMESFLRNRFDRMLGLTQSGEDPWAVAEEMWRRLNGNIRIFLEALPSERWVIVRYEELVRRPEAEMRRICRLLDRPFEEALLTPYTGSRMTDGLQNVSLGIGDPGFLRHDKIDPALADQWKRRLRPGTRLGAETLALAAQLGYDLASKEADRTPLLVSPVQREFLTLHGGDPRWNLSHRVSFEAREPLDRARFEAAWQTATNHQPMLRTFFRRGQGQDEFAAFEESERAGADLDWLDGSSWPAAEREQRLQNLEEEFNLAIRIQDGPLTRAAMIDLGENRFELLWVYHHLLGDGRSSALIIEEVLRCYDKPAGPAIPASSYQDYARQMAGLQIARLHESHLDFWRPHTAPPRLEIPADHVEPVQTFATEHEMADTWPGECPFEEAALALYQALSAWTGQQAPIISHRWHGRTVPGCFYHDTVGLFAVDLPLRFAPNRPDDTAPLTAGLKRFMAALPGSAFSYPLLAAERKIPRAEDVTAVRLNYQPAPLFPVAGPLTILGQATRTFQPPEARRPYSLDLIVRPARGRTSVLARYSRGAHEPTTLRQFLNLWQSSLLQLLKTP